MIRLALVCFFLSFLMLVSAGGAEPVASSGSETGGKVAAEVSAKETVPSPPKCKLTYEISSEIATVPITKVDTEFLKQEYLAQFTMDIPQVPPSLLKASEPGDRPELGQIEPLYRLFCAPVFPDRRYSEFLACMPEEHRPPKELADTLRSPFLYAHRVPSGGGFGMPSKDHAEDDYERVSYEIFAPTPERAKELVEGLLCFYAYGLSCPVQTEYVRGKTAESEKLPKLHAEIEQAKAVVAECDRGLKRLKEYADVTAETVSSLRTQQRVLEVDRAGVEARIEACIKVLEKIKTPTRLGHVESLKITAEIELVGLEARQQAISRIIKNGKDYLALSEKKRESAKRAEYVRSIIIPQTESGIQWCGDQQKAWAQCPVKDAKVVIRPVKFVPAHE